MVTLQFPVFLGASSAFSDVVHIEASSRRRNAEDAQLTKDRNRITKIFVIEPLKFSTGLRSIRDEAQ